VKKGHKFEQEHTEDILKSGETLSYLASHQAPNYVQHSQISQKKLNRFGAVDMRLQLFFQFI